MIVGADFIAYGGKLAVYSTEPDWRTSISRSYYGAYHHAREFLESKLQIRCPRSATSHDLVSQALKCTGIQELWAAGSILETLRGLRNKADYDIHVCRYGTQRVAMDAQVQAQDAKAKLDSIVDAVALRNAQQGINAKIRTLSGLTLKSIL